MRNLNESETQPPNTTQNVNNDKDGGGGDGGAAVDKKTVIISLFTVAWVLLNNARFLKLNAFSILWT